MRKASLQAVARVRGEREPTVDECEAAEWGAGLAGAYRSLPGRRSTAVEIVEAAPTTPGYRTPFVWVAAVALLAAGSMLATAPATAFWEARGHIAPRTVLGVPGAPESAPLLVFARVWSWLLRPLGPVEVSLTLFAVLCTAAFAAGLFLLFHRAIWGPSVAAGVPGRRGRHEPSRWASRRRGLALPGALAATLLAAAALTIWGPSLPAGSAFHLGGALVATGGWMLLRSYDRVSNVAAARWRLAGGYMFAVASAGVFWWLLPFASAALFLLRLRPSLLAASPGGSPSRH